MDFDVLKTAFDSLQKGQRCAFATVVKTTPKGTPRKKGAKMVVLEDGSFYGTIGGGRNEKAAQKECLKAIKTGQSNLVTYDYFGQKGQSVCGGQMNVFIEPFVEKKNMIICGGGHIALPLSVITKLLGFSVTIIDNRKEYADKKRFAHTDQVLFGRYSQNLKKITINPSTYIMIVTQGNEHDFECLKTVINSKAGYVGVISSKAKRIKFFNRLKSLGIGPSALRRIHIPAGLDIGGQSPAEIAVSIAAQIVQTNNQSSTGTDKWKREQTHDKR